MHVSQITICRGASAEKGLANFAHLCYGDLTVVTPGVSTTTTAAARRSQAARPMRDAPAGAVPQRPLPTLFLATPDLRSVAPPTIGPARRRNGEAAGGRSGRTMPA
jgi:hypothetical protein